MDTPHVISAFVPPICRHKGCSASFASRSQMAASTPAFAIRFSRIGASARRTCAADWICAASSSGTMYFVVISHAVSIVSWLKNGCSMATHSPYPASPRRSNTLTRRMRRRVARPKLVSNGALSGSSISLSSTRSSCRFMAPDGICQLGVVGFRTSARMPSMRAAVFDELAAAIVAQEPAQPVVQKMGFRIQSRPSGLRAG